MTNVAPWAQVEENLVQDSIHHICKDKRCNTSQRIKNPANFARDMKESLQKSQFNDTAVEKVARLVDNKVIFSRHDYYNLNQMFGVPSDIRREIENSYLRYSPQFSVTNNTTLEELSRFQPSAQVT